MVYKILAHTLHETADRAKAYFAKEYGATKFLCEKELEKDLPLRPTWQASLRSAYRLCVEVRESPFSATLHEFVTRCASGGHPVRLWVALPAGSSNAAFGKELKEAKDVGVGVVQVAEDGTAHEFHKPVAFSLFGLRRTKLSEVPPKRREALKNAEGEFLNGSPEQGCQLVYQELEAVTRKFAQYTSDNGMWKGTGATPTARFFTRDPWAPMLERLDEEIDQQKVKLQCPAFKRTLVAAVRAHTDSRNSVSHKPKNVKERQRRDAKLRTLFEGTRDLLVEWYDVARVLKLKVEP